MRLLINYKKNLFVIQHISTILFGTEVHALTTLDISLQASTSHNKTSPQLCLARGVQFSRVNISKQPSLDLTKLFSTRFTQVNSLKHFPTGTVSRFNTQIFVINHNHHNLSTKFTLITALHVLLQVSCGIRQIFVINRNHHNVVEHEVLC